jgi:hypothetical protein
MHRQVRKLSAALALVALAVAAGCKREEPAAKTPPPRDAFEVTASAPAAVQAGVQAELTVRLTARNGYHVNAEYPHAFRPGESTPGVRFEAERYDLKDRSEQTACEGAKADTCALVARIPFRAAETGPQRAAGVLAFSVCNPDICLIEKVPVAAPVDVR